MTACVHLKQLYQLCQEHDLKLSSSDLIRITCPQCGIQDVCPSALASEGDYSDDPKLSESKDV